MKELEKHCECFNYVTTAIQKEDGFYHARCGLKMIGKEALNAEIKALRKENEELRAKVCEYETAFDGIDDLQSKFDQANEKIKKLEEQLAESFATKFKIQDDKIKELEFKRSQLSKVRYAWKDKAKEQELVIERMREALKSIVDMPNYDQDNEHRLRYIAEQTLKEVNNE